MDWTPATPIGPHSAAPASFAGSCPSNSFALTPLADPPPVNPHRINLLQKQWGEGPSTFQVPLSHLIPLILPIPFLFKLLHTLSRHGAHSTLLFSSVCGLFLSRRGVGCGMLQEFTRPIEASLPSP